MIIQFLEMLRDERRLSPNTIAAYGSALKRYAQFLEVRNVSLEKAQRADIRAFIAKESQYSPRTINQWLSAIKEFYSFLVEEGKRLDNPAAGIRGPKVVSTPPQILSEEELKKILSQKFDSLRDKLVLHLLCKLGLRIGEAVTLRVKDIDVPANTIRVNGKGNKTRVLYLEKGLAELIMAYLGGRSTGMLLRNKRHKPLSVRYAREIVYRYAHTNPHTLRHSFATHMLLHGANLCEVQQWLGHASVATTQIYIYLNPENLKQAYLKTQPQTKSA